MKLQPGQRFGGRFTVLRELGGGGFGEVHEVEDGNTRARLALKVMHQEMVSHPVARERFTEEARLTSLFTSAHVVSVLDAGVDHATGRPWVAFELLSGETLADRLAREPALPPSLVELCFSQLGDALGAAHQAGVIHSDLKPENLFLSGPTQAPTLKVLDFGIARMLRAGRTSTRVTTEMGTPRWTAPEQFVRGSRLRPSTDVWPLGMLAFKLLTGVHYLRHGGDDAEVVRVITEICAGELPAASTRARELGVEDRLPDDFDRWFQHCVVREPELRFQHGRAAVHAFLTLFRGHRPVAPTVLLGSPPARVEPLVVAFDARSRPLAIAVEKLSRHDFVGARWALEEAVNTSDAPAEAWALLGECDLALGRYDTAADDWSHALILRPTSEAYLLGRAMAFEAAGRKPLAAADLALARALGHGATHARPPRSGGAR